MPKDKAKNKDPAFLKGGVLCLAFLKKEKGVGMISCSQVYNTTAKGRILSKWGNIL